MSKLSQKRKLWKYTPQAPRCVNCAHYRASGMFLRNSLPVKSPTLCKLGDFIVGPNGICEKHEEGAKQ
jgi:hypothetical protein